MSVITGVAVTDHIATQNATCMPNTAVRDQSATQNATCMPNTSTVEAEATTSDHQPVYWTEKATKMLIEEMKLLMDIKAKSTKK